VFERLQLTLQDGPWVAHTIVESDVVTFELNFDEGPLVRRSSKKVWPDEIRLARFDRIAAVWHLMIIEIAQGVPPDEMTQRIKEFIAHALVDNARR